MLHNSGNSLSSMMFSETRGLDRRSRIMPRWACIFRQFFFLNTLTLSAL